MESLGSTRPPCAQCAPSNRFPPWEAADDSGTQCAVDGRSHFLIAQITDKSFISWGGRMDHQPSPEECAELAKRLEQLQAEIDPVREILMRALSFTCDRKRRPESAQLLLPYESDDSQ
jgi:hypothetical protein